MEIHIGHLYPATMGTYGDIGNIICLQQRAAWRGIRTVVHELEVGTPLPPRIDFYFFGGGQDIAQGWLGQDLLEQKAPRLKEDVAAGVPLLAICGGYQLLGRSYKPFDAPPIEGVGLFPVVTEASHDRMIGNLVITANPRLGLPETHPAIVGFENHSGKTRILDSVALPLGTVMSGFGNNGEDHTEGCVVGSAVGCYLHGSLLPKNPHLADWFLDKACKRHDSQAELASLDDSLEWQAHDYLVERFGKS